MGDTFTGIDRFADLALDAMIILKMKCRGRGGGWIRVDQGSVHWRTLVIVEINLRAGHLHDKCSWS